LLPTRVSLEARISWRLPMQPVRELARKLICSPGDAVRRVVAAALQSADQWAALRVHQTPVVKQPKPHNPTVQPCSPTVPQASPIVSEEILSQDPRGWVVILQRDARGFGYTRTLPMSCEAYLRTKRL
jgi:hypothetical protein